MDLIRRIITTLTATRNRCLGCGEHSESMFCSFDCQAGESW